MLTVWIVMAHLMSSDIMHEQSRAIIHGDSQEWCQNKMAESIDRIRYNPDYKTGDVIHAICTPLDNYEGRGMKWHYGSNVMMHPDGSLDPNVIFYTRSYPESQ